MIPAIIPARGGSEGIEKKNITAFLGRPLIEHTIAQSAASDRIDTPEDLARLEAIAETSGFDPIVGELS